MAYVNLVNQGVANKAEIFCRIRDFICKRNGTYDYSATGIGWTLFDSSYAVDEDNPQLNDWFVVYSPGENGKEDIFCKIVWNSGYISYYMYLSWNPTTHAGTTSYTTGTSACFYLAEAQGSTFLSIYGDLDFVFPFVYYAANDYRGGWFGSLDPAVDTFDRDTAICSSALSAGSDVSITVDSIPTSWEVGTQLFIRTTHTDNISTSKIECITIKTISGNTITADLSNSYTANSKLCVFMCYACVMTYAALSTTGLLIDGNGVSGNTAQVLYAFFTGTYNDPMSFASHYGLQDIFLQVPAGHPAGKLKNIKALTALGSCVDGDILDIFNSSEQYRLRRMYSGMTVLFREV